MGRNLTIGDECCRIYAHQSVRATLVWLVCCQIVPPPGQRVYFMWPSSSIIISLVQQQHLVKSDLQLYSFSYFYFMQEWMPVQFYGGTVLYGPLEGFAILCLQHKTTRDAGFFRNAPLWNTNFNKERRTHIHTHNRTCAEVV